jgi:hypothetical protein
LSHVFFISLLQNISTFLCIKDSHKIGQYSDYHRRAHIYSQF